MKYVKKLLKLLLPKLTFRPVIIFESYPDLSDNTFEVFKELANRGYQKKYKFVWQLANRNAEDIKYLKTNKYSYYYLFYKNIFEHLQSILYRYSAALLLCNNVFLEKKSENQKYFYLAHGVALKNCSNYYHLPDSALDATVLSLSDFFKEYDSKNIHCKQENIVPLGFPRNDVLLKEKRNLKDVFSGYDFDNAVYWLPTYRQHKYGDSVSSISIPIIHNEEICNNINSFAKENKTLIIIKPHPAQDLSLINRTNYSNLVFIDNDFLNDNGISNYELLSSSDALITDYSTVYYDYLLCDKPIGLCWEDFDEYNKNEGFTVDVNYVMSGGEKIYNTEEFCDFIKRVSNGEDVLRNEREKIKKVVHKYCDSDSTKRVVDYIEENFFE